MKLQQYINSFLDPLQAEDPKPLVRLLDARNKTARGLSDTVGPIDVSVGSKQLHNARLRHVNS